MIQELTKIDKKFKLISGVYWLLLLAISLILLLSSCTGARSVQGKNSYVKNNNKKRTVARINEAQNDTTIAKIEEFGNQLSSNEDNAPRFTKHEDNPVKSNTINLGSKKLLTLREQMNSLAEDQESIKSQVNALGEDVSQIKNSINEIKDAVAVIRFSPEKTPIRGDKSEENTTEESGDKGIEVNDEIYEDQGAIYSDEVNQNKMERSQAPIIKSQPKPAIQKATKKAKVIPSAPTKKNKAAGKHAAVINKENKIVTSAPKNIEKKQAANNYKLAGKANIDNPTKPAASKPAASKPTVSKPGNIKSPEISQQNIQQALNHFSKKDYQGAINELNIVLTKEKDPQTAASCNYWLGESYFRMGSYANAVKFFEKAAGTSYSKSEEAKVMIGESFLRSGKTSEAKKSFEQFIKNNPKSKYLPRAKKLLQQL
jgi:TolA-binding protein